MKKISISEFITLLKNSKQYTILNIPTIKIKQKYNQITKCIDITEFINISLLINYKPVELYLDLFIISNSLDVILQDTIFKYLKVYYTSYDIVYLKVRCYPKKICVKKFKNIIYQLTM